MVGGIRERDTEGMPALLSVKQLAAYLDIPVSTIYLWRSLGKGPRGLKVGKRIRYRATDVAAWLDAQGEVGESEETIGSRA